MSRRLWLAATSVAVLALSPLAVEPAAELDEFGGLRGVRRAATGFFRTTRAHGRWWLVDPNGFLFVTVGVKGVSLAPYPEAGDRGDSYRQAALAKHGSEEQWAKAAVDRLRSWGFNTLGVGSDPIVRRQQMPCVVSLQCAAVLGPVERGRFPDVFDPAYERAVRRHALRVCRPYVDDRWLLGYITDTHPLSALGAKDSVSLLTQFLALPDGAAGRRALLEFLATRHLNIRELNIAWGTQYDSFEGIGRTPQVGSRIPQGDADAFQREVAREYMRIAHDSIRAVDAYHLILGPRFEQSVPRPVLEVMGESVDAVCLDYRGAAPPADHLREIHRVSGWPVILTEFEPTRPAKPEAAQVEGAQPGEPSGPTAEMYQQFVRELVLLPMVVGYHWHSYADAPASPAPGPSPGPAGLVDAQDEPHRELVEAASEVNKQIYELAGAPTAQANGGRSETP